MIKRIIFCLFALVAPSTAFSTLNPDAVVKAPEVTASVYNEAIPMLYASSVIYQFSDLIGLARNGEITLEVPDDFPLKLSDFQEQSLDFRNLNGGNGISFSQLYELMVLNKDNIRAKFAEEEFTESIIQDVIAYVQTEKGAGDDLFLSTFRALKGDVACVYGVLKDRRNKRGIVFFRGSVRGGRDWPTNFNARLTSMRTPKKVADKMNGILQKRMLVHRGFYEYLFDNEKLTGDQRYDNIIDDVEPLMEDGYSMYVTGHSLGGALATMFSLKLAGAGKKRDWVPRPLTCITYAAPFSGTEGYRAVFEQLEVDGWIRSLRVTNGEDIVPALPSVSLGRKRTMKQTGINLRLTSSGMRIRHSSMDGFSNAIRNSIFKPVWSGRKWHGVPLHNQRMEMEANNFLRETTLNELYQNPDVVSEKFLKGDIDYSEEMDSEDIKEDL